MAASPRAGPAVIRFLRNQWRIPRSAADVPAYVPRWMTWRILRVVKPVVNAVGVVFAALAILAVFVLLAVGCSNEAETLVDEDANNQPGMTVWLDRSGRPEKMIHNQGQPGEPIVIKIYDHKGKLSEQAEFDGFEDVVRTLPPAMQDRLPELARTLAKRGTPPDSIAKEREKEEPK